MTPQEWAALDPDEQEHFYQCKKCGQMVDMRQLDEVLFREDHKPRLDIPYGGSERIS